MKSEKMTKVTKVMKANAGDLPLGWSIFTPKRCSIVALSAGISFTVLALWIRGKGSDLPTLDRSIHDWVIAHRTPTSETYARLITRGGVTTYALPALLLIGLAASEAAGKFTRRIRAALYIFLVACAGAGAGLQINALEGRVRPPKVDWAGVAGGPSFPSGHTTVATLFAASAAWVLATRIHGIWPKRALWIGAITYAAAVGLSRIWLGVHWPTDVIGGWLYSLSWLAGSAALVLAIRKRAELKKA